MRLPARHPKPLPRFQDPGKRCCPFRDSLFLGADVSHASSARKAKTLHRSSCNTGAERSWPCSQECLVEP